MSTSPRPGGADLISKHEFPSHKTRNFDLIKTLILLGKVTNLTEMKAPQTYRYVIMYMFVSSEDVPVLPVFPLFTRISAILPVFQLFCPYFRYLARISAILPVFPLFYQGFQAIVFVNIKIKFFLVEMQRNILNILN